MTLHLAASFFIGFLLELFQIINDPADGVELGRILIIDGDAVHILQGHDQFNDIERIGAEVVDQTGVHGDGLGIDLKLLGQSVSYIFKNHWLILQFILLHLHRTTNTVRMQGGIYSFGEFLSAVFPREHTRQIFKGKKRALFVQAAQTVRVRKPEGTGLARLQDNVAFRKILREAPHVAVKVLA